MHNANGSEYFTHNEEMITPGLLELYQEDTCVAATSQYIEEPRLLFHESEHK